MFKKAGLLAVGALALGLGINSASMAADWPKRPITMVVPYKAGGTTETMGQVLSKALGRELGTKVIVKTKPGGGSAVVLCLRRTRKLTATRFCSCHSVSSRGIRWTVRKSTITTVISAFWPASVSTRSVSSPRPTSLTKHWKSWSHIRRRTQA